jgi:hypothetical protein
MLFDAEQQVQAEPPSITVNLFPAAQDFVARGGVLPANDVNMFA